MVTWHPGHPVTTTEAPVSRMFLILFAVISSLAKIEFEFRTGVMFNILGKLVAKDKLPYSMERRNGYRIISIQILIVGMLTDFILLGPSLS
jgi:hypothetical protein